MAAINCVRVSAAGAASNTDATTYAGGAATPVANATYFVVSAARVTAGQTQTPTLSGTNEWNVTWTDRSAGGVLVNSLLRLTVFSGVIGGSPTSGVLTADYTGQTQEAHVLGVFRVLNAGQVPVQTKTGTTVGGT